MSVCTNIDIDARDAYGFTPLMYAAMDWNIAIIVLFVKAQADVSVKGNVGKTSLILMCASELNDALEVVKVLVNAGARLYVRDVLERTALVMLHSTRVILRVL